MRILLCLIGAFLRNFDASRQARYRSVPYLTLGKVAPSLRYAFKFWQTKVTSTRPQWER